jgi:uncharacterized protein YegP (UPF0339 family)
MRKLLCLLAFFAAVGVLVASVSPSAPAQQKDKKDEKKEDKKDTKKDDKKEAKKDNKTDDGKIEVYQGKDGWRFRVYAPDGKLIAVGVQSYANKADCTAAVEVLKTTMAKAKVTEIPKEKKK